MEHVISTGKTTYLDLDKDVFVIGTRMVALTRIQVHILQFLIENQGCPVSKRELTLRIWGFCSRTQEEDLYVAIHRLRRKIEDVPTKPKYILVVKGVGYRFGTS